MPKPIIQWIGGKAQLLNEIIQRMPKQYDHYYEPFFGGGALFFELSPNRATINDLNRELINLYTIVKDNPQGLMNAIEEHQNNHSKDYYYYIRNDFNKRIKSPDDLGLMDASEFIYLNKTGFNGLYRVNSKGKYNVPIGTNGKKKQVNLYSKENIESCSKLLNHTTIYNGDFEDALHNAKEGDFVFFDSPYYNTFDKYQAGGFSEQDHIRLADTYKRLSNKGVYCLMTNSATDFIKELYGEFNIETIPVKRSINCKGNKRTGEELIIINY